MKNIQAGLIFLLSPSFAVFVVQKSFFALACTNFRSFVFIFEAIVVVISAHAFFYVGKSETFGLRFVRV